MGESFTGERRRHAPPGRWESWVQVAAIIATLLGAVWTMRGSLDRIVGRQEIFLQHLCRIEATLYHAAYADCSDQLRAPADPVHDQ